MAKSRPSLWASFRRRRGAGDARRPWAGFLPAQIGTGNPPGVRARSAPSFRTGSRNTEVNDVVDIEPVHIACGWRRDECARHPPDVQNRSWPGSGLFRLADSPPGGFVRRPPAPWPEALCSPRDDADPFHPACRRFLQSIRWRPSAGCATAPDATMTYSFARNLGGAGHEREDVFLTESRLWLRLPRKGARLWSSLPSQPRGYLRDIHRGSRNRFSNVTAPCFARSPRRLTFTVFGSTGTAPVKCSGERALAAGILRSNRNAFLGHRLTALSETRKLGSRAQDLAAMRIRSDEALRPAMNGRSRCDESRGREFELHIVAGPNMKPHE